MLVFKARPKHSGDNCCPLLVRIGSPRQSIGKNKAQICYFDNYINQVTWHQNVGNFLQYAL